MTSVGYVLIANYNPLHKWSTLSLYQQEEAQPSVIAFQFVLNAIPEKAADILMRRHYHFENFM